MELRTGIFTRLWSLGQTQVMINEMALKESQAVYEAGPGRAGQGKRPFRYEKSSWCHLVPSRGNSPTIRRAKHFTTCRRTFWVREIIDTGGDRIGSSECFWVKHLPESGGAEEVHNCVKTGCWWMKMKCYCLLFLRLGSCRGSARNCGGVSWINIFVPCQPISRGRFLESEGGRMTRAEFPRTLENGSLVLRVRTGGSMRSGYLWLCKSAIEVSYPAGFPPVKTPGRFTISGAYPSRESKGNLPAG